MAASANARRVAAVGVAISTLDRPEALERCLRSLAHGAVLPAEVVVVDQSASASAMRVVETVEGLPEVRHVAQTARGLALAQNEAVAQTTTPLVAVLDDDCVADGAWIGAVEQALAATAPADLVGGRVLPLPAADPSLVAVSSRTRATPRDFRSRLRPWEVGSGNNFAFRREWFEAIGGCDVRLGPGAPGRGAVDIDLFYRCLRAGARVRYEPTLLVHHARATRAERLARRSPYGYGMGAACAKWLRERDAHALGVLAAWLALRLALLVRAGLDRRPGGVREELLVLAGTVRGLAWGLHALEPAR